MEHLLKDGIESSCDRNSVGKFKIFFLKKCMVLFL